MSGLVLGQTVGRVERVTDIVKFDQVAVDHFWEYLDVSSELQVSKGSDQTRSPTDRTTP
jgi:hypothetical protein